MPIYEYQCNQCGKVFEELIIGSSREDIKCPDCGLTDVKRLMSQTHTTGTSKLSGGCTPNPSAGFG